MGIRGLAKHLRKSAIEHTIGCSSTDCTLDSRVVIDGPSFAYWIYNNLARALTGAGNLYEQPSYGLICDSALEFLDELERCHIQVLRIYFDGGLPKWKQSTRLARLRQDYKFRKALKQRNPDGLQLIVRPEAKVSLQTLLSVQHDHSGSQNHLGLPFLVPLVIECIRASRFAPVVEVVPDEADAWCAAFAKEHDALILTGDSDLVVYDVGLGQVAFLNSLAFATCDRCSARSITARILQPEKIAQELLSSDIQHAAYKLHQTTTAGIDTNRKRGKSSKNKRDPGYNLTDTFESFMESYPCIDLGSNKNIRHAIAQLDPRLSEIVVQMLRPADAIEVTVMLPSLSVEDFERASAWKASEQIRRLVYALLIKAVGQASDFKFTEYVERGQIDGRGRAIKIPGDDDLIATMRTLISLWELIREGLVFESERDTCWQTILCVHVIHYLVTTSNLSKSDIGSSLSNLFGAGSMRSVRTWPETQLQARLEATYYAFRQLQQALHFVMQLDQTELTEELPQLHQLMNHLPWINSMFICSNLLRSANVNFDFAFRVVVEITDSQDQNLG